mgnify:CR=1 FL=1
MKNKNNNNSTNNKNNKYDNCDNYDNHDIHNDKLDLDGFRAWRTEFANAEFILDDDGTYPQSVGGGAFSSEANLTVVRPPLPALSVDDPLLSLVSVCGTYQTTRLRATASGVDVARHIGT